MAIRQFFRAGLGLGLVLGSVATVPTVSAAHHEANDAPTPVLQRLSAQTLRTDVFKDPRTETLTESSELGDTPATDLVWHESADQCLQTGVYETGPNRYTIDEPYPYDELMMFISGGVTLTPTEGEPMTVVAGDTVMMPAGWTGVWDSAGYRKVYVIYNCPDS